jgi:hypothetical protein
MLTHTEWYGVRTDTPSLGVLAGLNPAPEEEWDKLRAFLPIAPDEKAGMLASVEALFRRGPELVVNTYDYLLAHHETAAILGWESGANLEHLSERRRFFTIWLARALGLDMSHDFAHYLFRAGQIHAAHGPRQIQVPERYVTGAISQVNAAFARFLTEEMPGHPVVPAALAGWNKLLSLHLHMMLLGYQSARAWDEGEVPLTVTLYGKMRHLTQATRREMHLAPGEQVIHALRKFFNYYPQTRAEVFATGWQEGERLDETGKPWLTVSPTYQFKTGWRLLLDGRDLSYHGGLAHPIEPGQTLSIFPPGR